MKKYLGKGLILTRSCLSTNYPAEVDLACYSWKGRGWGQVITDSGSFLKDISMFDHLEFGVTAKDARAMAVSTRKLIELSFLALLDSGINYRGQRVGCYTAGNPFDILSIADPVWQFFAVEFKKMLTSVG